MTKHKVIALAVLFIGGFVSILILLANSNIAVMAPKGLIAAKERDLLITALLLMLIVVIPVFILTFIIAWKFRESNKKAKYTPDWDHHRGIEFIWWTVPIIIITILAIITWFSTHELDPYKPLVSDKKPVKIQVVALQWKWLFIYPDHKIASVNFVQFPSNTPLNFEMTSDAPMNSFWIPQLGGQIYAMSGMSTKLHLMANTTGNFAGSSANISGEGFAGMRFVAKSSSQSDFEKWLEKVKQSKTKLDMSEYNKLASPSKNNKVQYYRSVDPNLYDKVILKYMAPEQENSEMEKMGDTEHMNMEGMGH